MQLERPAHKSLNGVRKAVIGGGGVAGLAAAWELRRLGWEVELHEASDSLGGLLKPFAFRDIDCDLGSHRLHPEALGEPLLQALKSRVDFETLPRCGRILLGGRQLAYPLSLPGLLTGLGPQRALRCGLDLLRQRARLGQWERERQDPSHDVGFEAFVLQRAGRAAYEAFYRPYAQKVWGLPPDQLSQTTAKARFSTARPLQAALARPNRTFLYPRGGMAALLRALAEAAQSAGVTVRTGRPLNPQQVDADVVLHAGRLRDLTDPTNAFGHLGLHLVFLALPLPRLGPVDTWYVPEAQFWFGRVSNVRNFSPQLGKPAETVLCCEIPAANWGPDHDFQADLPALVEQLERAGILPRGVRPVAVAQRYVPDVYPLYRRGWVDRWRQALHHLANQDRRVLPIGRQGLYLHCNVDHALATARLAAAHAHRGGDAHGWQEQAAGFLGLRVRD